MTKAGGGGMVSLLYQCPSPLLKHTHFTDPSIKHFHSGTLKDVFLFLKRLFNASKDRLRCRKKGRRMEETEGRIRERQSSEKNTVPYGEILILKFTLLLTFKLKGVSSELHI